MGKEGGASEGGASDVKKPNLSGSPATRRKRGAKIHHPYISQLERGLKSPTLSMILKLSRALKASASKLVATVERGG